MTGVPALVTHPYTLTKIKNTTLLFLSPFFWELKDFGHFLCTGKAYFSQILFTNLSKEEQSVICSQLVRGTFNWNEGTNIDPCSFSEFSAWVWPEPASLSLSLSISLFSPLHSCCCSHYNISVLVFIWLSGHYFVLFRFFINLIQKYDWNILCLLNSSFCFQNTKRPAQVWSVRGSRGSNG